MEETILSLLKARFADVPDTILEGIANSQSEAITTQEEANSFVEGITLQNIFESYGNQRAAEAASAANTPNAASQLGEAAIAHVATADMKPSFSAQYEDLIRQMIDAKIDAKVAPLQKQVEEYAAREAAQARESTILRIAKELDIPQFRIDEGFSIASDADENAIKAHLSKVKQNIVTASLGSKNDSSLLASLGDIDKGEADSWASALPDK